MARKFPNMVWEMVLKERARWLKDVKGQNYALVHANEYEEEERKFAV